MNSPATSGTARDGFFQVELSLVDLTIDVRDDKDGSNLPVLVKDVLDSLSSDTAEAVLSHPPPKKAALPISLGWGRQQQAQTKRRRQEVAERLHQQIVRFLKVPDKYIALTSILLKSRAFHMTHSTATATGETTTSTTSLPVIEIPRTDYRKPYIPKGVDPSLKHDSFPEVNLYPLSISHQFPFAGMARLVVGGAAQDVHRQPLVGLDIVAFDDFNRQLYATLTDFVGVFQESFTPWEWKCIHSTPQTEMLQEFYLRWAIKEAYTKALGVGMGLPFDSFETRLQDIGGGEEGHGIYSRLRQQLSFSADGSSTKTTGDEGLFLRGSVIIKPGTPEAKSENCMFFFLPLWDQDAYGPARSVDGARGCACVCLVHSPDHNGGDALVTTKWQSLDDLITWHRLFQPTGNSGAVATSASTNEAPPAHVINFGCGHPDASLLPVQMVATATQRALVGEGGSGGQEWLQYARENGNPRARKALAEFLTSLYYGDNGDVVVDPATLCVTSGVSHGIQLTCRTLQRMRNHNRSKNSESGDNDIQEQPLCLVEDPTYFLVPAIFQQSGYELQAVATSSAHGLDLIALEDIVQASREASPDRLVVLYSIPVHHNPLGVSLSEQDRSRLVALCEQYGVYLIADEVYHGLGFTSTNKEDSAPLPMALRSSWVISVSAFTKILCPGIRCGWIQTTNLDLLGEIGKDAVLDSGGCSSQLSSGIVTQMIHESTLGPYMASLQVDYAKRCHHLCQLLQEASSSPKEKNTDFGFEFQIPRGGYFLWVKVTGIDFAIDEAFRSFCRTEYDVDFKTGTKCSSATWQIFIGQQQEQQQLVFSQCIRLCFAYYDTPTLTQGVERLCQAIQAYSRKKTQR